MRPGKDLISGLLDAGTGMLKATAERFPLIAALLREQSPADLAAGKVRTPEALAREGLRRGRGQDSGIEDCDFAFHDGYASLTGSLRPLGGGRKVSADAEVELVSYEATRERVQIVLRVRKGLTAARAKHLPQLVPWIARAQVAYQLLDESLLAPIGEVPDSVRVEGKQITVDLDAVPGVHEAIRLEIGGMQVVDLFEIVSAKIVEGAVEVTFRIKPDGVKKIVGAGPRAALGMLGKLAKGFKR